MGAALTEDRVLTVGRDAGFGSRPPEPAIATSQIFVLEGHALLHRLAGQPTERIDLTRVTAPPLSIAEHRSTARCR
jgi:hypothetical protein